MKTKKTNLRRKLTYGIPMGMAVGALSAVSVAWACTPQNGWTIITDPVTAEGKKGTVVKAHADGITDDSTGFGNTYKLFFSGQAWCHSGSVFYSVLDVHSGGGNPDLGEAQPAAADDGTGTISYTTGAVRMPVSLTDEAEAKVPSGNTVKRRSYDVCFGNGNGSTASHSSSPSTFTIT